MMRKDEETGRFEIEGVISWGIKCAEANMPGVFADVMGNLRNIFFPHKSLLNVSNMSSMTQL